MSNKMAEAMAILGQKMKDFNSSLVTYRRADASVELYATIGRQLLRTSDRMGNTKTELTERDFLFDSADLILHGEQTVPQDGDIIEMAFDGVAKQFTLMPVGNEKSWRYSDEQGETRIRAHTKYTGDA